MYLVGEIRVLNSNREEITKKGGLKKQKLKQERTEIGNRDDNKTVNYNTTKAYHNETGTHGK